MSQSGVVSVTTHRTEYVYGNIKNDDDDDNDNDAQAWSRQRPTEEVGLRTGSIHGRRWTRTLWCGWLQDPDFAGYTAEYTEKYLDRYRVDI